MRGVFGLSSDLHPIVIADSFSGAARLRRMSNRSSLRPAHSERIHVVQFILILGATANECAEGGPLHDPEPSLRVFREDT